MTNLTSVFLLIKEMQRKFKAREAEKKEMEVCVFVCVCVHARACVRACVHMRAVTCYDDVIVCYIIVISTVGYC